MRKILKLVLGLLLVGSMVFGADTSQEFEITTTINGFTYIKLGTPTSTTPTNRGAFEAFGNSGTAFTITDTNYKTDEMLVKKIFAMSNNRNGYSISMSATALTYTEASFSDYINYTIKAGGATITTNNETTVSPTSAVANVSDLTGVTINAYDVRITVNETDYENALNETYTATVNFIIAAN